MSHRKVLDHSDQGVVDGPVAMWVIGTHHFTHDLGALGVRTVGSETLVKHRIQDATVDRLESVAHVGKCSRNNDRHGVLQEGALHLEIDFNRFDVSDYGIIDWRGGVVFLFCHGLLPLPRCRGSARPLRWFG